VGPLDLQSLSFADVPELSPRDSESESHCKPGAFRDASPRGQQSGAFLTEEEKKLRKVIGAKWPLHLPELDLAINTGLRKGSQYGLTWDMVD